MLTADASKLPKEFYYRYPFASQVLARTRALALTRALTLTLTRALTLALTLALALTLTLT